MTAATIAVTGMGCVTPFGVGVSKFVEGLRNGSQVGRFKNFTTPALTGGRLICECQSAPELASALGGRVNPILPRATLMALVAAREAWTQSGIDTFTPERGATVISRNFSQHEVTAKYFSRLWDAGAAGVSGLQFVQTVANAVLGTIATEFSLRGPSIMSLGGSSLMLAADLLRNGEAEFALVGMADELSEFVLAMLEQSSLLICPERGEHLPVPYRAGGHKLVPAEAAAFFVLETPHHAVARGAKQFAYLRGFASVLDADGRENPLRRNAASVCEAFDTALLDAETPCPNINRIVGSGSGLRDYDDAEIDAVAQRFDRRQTPLDSCKQGTGETWGANAALALIAAIHRAFDCSTTFAESAPPSTVNHRANASATSARDAYQELVLVSSMDMNAEDSAYVYELLGADAR